MLDYTAIDFETANSYRGSPCSVGLVKVRDGKVVDTRHWLIRPPEAVDFFDGWNIAIHGITPERVATAPRWREILPHIVDFIGSDVVVAHNAGFDIGVIRYACAVDNIEWPALRFLCTLALSRRALRLPTYRLPYVAESLGFVVDDHHDALADAKAVVEIVGRLSAQLSASTLDDLAGCVHVGIGHMSAGTYKGSTAISSGGGSNLVQPDLNPDADPNGYLYSRVVVFTGTLMSMTRQIAWEECARVGAAAENNVTKRTNILVVGDINPAVLRPGSELTGKARKAFELQDQGQEIEVMTEDDFLRCLDGKPLDGAEALLTEATNPLSATQSIRSLTTRSTPLAERAERKRVTEPDAPPKPLRRTPTPTDQVCSEENCGQPAAFKTNKGPRTLCHAHVEEVQRAGGVRPLESFTHPQDWQLTECLNCGVQAHYRFVYTSEKNVYGEATCRACYWRAWARDARALQGAYADFTPVPYSEAQAYADEHGYDYLQPLTAPSLRDDPHLVKCRRCTRISAQRLGDIYFGCSCTPKN